MCAIYAITQFEVHSYTDGRWTLQSRFPSDERQAAMADAVYTEQSTRRPCKVVKETYYPHENRHDSVTVYVTPKAKELMAKLKTPAAGHAGRAGAERAARGMSARSNGKAPGRVAPPRAADLFWRSIIAIALALVTATVITAVVSWLINRLPALGINLDPSFTGTILTAVYLIAFILGVLPLFKLGAPIKRMLAIMWANAAPPPPVTAQQTAAIFSAAGMRLKPKRTTQVAFERQRQDLAEMKTARGDLDTLPPPPPLPPVIQEAPPTLPPTPQPTVAEEIAKAQKAVDAKAAADAAKAAADAARAAAEAALAAQPAVPAAAQAQTPVQGISELHRALATRFALEVMLPQIARAPNDPVTRRGAALFMTGAMAHLAALSNLGAEGEMGLTISALPTALPRHAVDAYVGQYNIHVTTPANVTIITQGRQAMARFLGGQSNDGMLATALSAWRTPQSISEFAAPAAATAPTDYYLMSEVRHDAAEVMEAHNGLIREILEKFDGTEIKHTGKGILARFEKADHAMQAALEFSRRFGASAGVPADAIFAAALVAGTGAADDPLLSATVIKAAQDMLAAAPRGAVISQPPVYRNTTPTDNVRAEPFAISWLKIAPGLTENAPPAPAATAA